MADETESAPRARPFTPPLPPFRGPATMARPSTTALTPPEARRGALFIGTRAPTKPAAAAEPVLPDIAQLAPEPPVRAETPLAAVVAPERPAQPSVEPDSSRSEAVAATEAMPWLFADPQTADRLMTPAAPIPVVSNVVPQEESVQPFDAAAVLESIATRIRAGRIDVGQLEQSAGEAAVLATVLAALLRQRVG